MPISLQHPLQPISEKDFHELDYHMMRLAFAVHHELGRFYDENIYQTELCRRCMDENILVTREFEIKLIHEGYVKSLYVDLLVNKSTVYELKALKAIIEPNRIQTLNYLFSTNTHHGKLINFRPISVEHEFVSTKLDAEKRAGFSILDDNWGRSNQTSLLRTKLINLLSDWGAFLDTDVYMDAICHFLGGKDHVIRPIPIYSKNNQIGQQKMPHLSSSETFCITSVTKNLTGYQDHLIRLLKHTTLESIHWINFNRLNIHLTSLSRKSFCP